MTKKMKPAWDVPAIDELSLFIDNQADLYRQREVPLQKNFEKKLVKGSFVFDKAVGGVQRNLVDIGARQYAKEFGGSSKDMFPRDVRKAVAKRKVRMFRQEFNLGNLQGGMTPTMKKEQKSAQKRIKELLG